MIKLKTLKIYTQNNLAAAIWLQCLRNLFNDVNFPTTDLANAEMLMKHQTDLPSHYIGHLEGMRDNVTRCK